MNPEDVRTWNNAIGILMGLNGIGPEEAFVRLIRDSDAEGVTPLDYAFSLTLDYPRWPHD